MRRYIGVFSHFKCDFVFNPGGSIVVESQVQTTSVENYKAGPQIRIIVNYS